MLISVDIFDEMVKANSGEISCRFHQSSHFKAHSITIYSLLLELLRTTDVQTKRFMFYTSLIRTNF